MVNKMIEIYEKVENLMIEEAKANDKKYYKIPSGVVFFEAKKIMSYKALEKLDEIHWNKFSDWLNMLSYLEKPV